ncbi:MAG: hypothetical protein NC548_13125 [Lachnospiraceae bacterium]|nr:hypothetical protein [Lachnospiraceae bacterium]MCM1230668.1 hypothetical protein [Ruminococcus flavefaciens]
MAILDTFDPDHITKEQMNFLADHIERYADELGSSFVIPNELRIEHEDQINEAMKRVRILIKKLRKGDTSVFKDEDEFNSLW